MRTPAQIAIPSSSAEVTAEIKRLLRAAEVLGKIPTPKDQILACAKLVETGDLDLREYDATFSERASGFFHKAWGKVLGFLDRRTQEIYVDPLLSDSRKIFVRYHEVVHRVLPWQNATYAEDDDATLSSNCSVLFESEANFGAADILFQCERFESEASDYELSIPSALYLSEKYAASYHASLRRFVERNHRPCLLLVLKPTSREHADGGTSFYICYPVPSPTFALNFGDPFTSPFINPEHTLGKILNDGRSGEIRLADLKGFQITCGVECFTNQYHTFLLISPKLQPAARRRVVLREMR
jgi:hypothetical protein